MLFSPHRPCELRCARKVCWHSAASASLVPLRTQMKITIRAIFLLLTSFARRVVGTLRFAGMSDLIPLHKFMSEFAASDVGIPMIGAAFHLFSGKISPGRFKMHRVSLGVILSLFLAASLVKFLLPAPQQEIYRTRRWA